MRKGIALLIATTVLVVAGFLVWTVAGSGASDELPAAPVIDTTVRDPLTVPANSRSREPKTVEYTLVAREVIAKIDDDRRFFTWTYALEQKGAEEDVAVPGPMLRANEGDTVIINFKNPESNIEPHDIDFHAVAGPGGGGAVLEAEPGESKRLKFKATKRGAYIYHCAGEGMPWEHVGHGMYGLFQVDPPGGLPPVDRELYVGQNEWYLSADAKPVAGADGVESYDLDEDKATAERPDLITFNGHKEALLEKKLKGTAMTADRGDTVRVFFVNGGPNLASNLHVIGALFDSAYAGDPRDADRGDETYLVPPGSAMVAEFTARTPGRYTLVDHALFRVPRGAAARITVKPECMDEKSCKWPRELYSPPAVHRDEEEGHGEGHEEEGGLH